MRYNALIDRFSYLIRGQFYGHTHSDHLGFFLSMPEHKNVRTDPLSNYYLIAPSLTTYSNRMPEFRLMEVDYDTMQVIDYHQYRYICSYVAWIFISLSIRRMSPSFNCFIPF